tara:strand:+ start:5086 stop:5343 length:258 start_codon:yes stop_codon:yes gene_type:complete
MPEISRFYGIIIKMYFNEHNPPHFHMEYQGFKAKVEINTGILEGKMPKTAINLTLQWLSEHRQELLENWERIESLEPLKKIDPLT